MAQTHSRATRHLPAGLCLLALMVCVLSLSYQGVQLWQLLQVPADYTQAPPATPPRVVDRQQLAMLFPAPLAGPAPVTTLQLTLLAVFRNPDQQRSAAIIRQPGQAAQRIVVGADIAPGIRLHSVSQHYVTLDRHGRQESLHFPQQHHQPLLSVVDVPEQATAPQPDPGKVLADL